MTININIKEGVDPDLLYQYGMDYRSGCPAWQMCHVPRNTIIIYQQDNSVYLTEGCKLKCYHIQFITYRIHSNRHSCPNRHPPPPSSSCWHTKMGEIDDSCVKNAQIHDELSLYMYLQLFCPLLMILRSDFETMITVFSQRYAHLQLLAHPPVWALSQFQIQCNSMGKYIQLVAPPIFS